jgi:hypothetical protein
MAQPPPDDDARRQRLTDALQAALLLSSHIVTVSRELTSDAARCLNAIERAIAAVPPPASGTEPRR